MPGAPRAFGPENGVAGGARSLLRTLAPLQEPPSPLLRGVCGWLWRGHSQDLAAVPAADQRAVTHPAANRDHLGLRLVLRAPHRCTPSYGGSARAGTGLLPLTHRGATT